MATAKRILIVIALWMFFGCLCAGCGSAQFVHDVTGDAHVNDPAIGWVLRTETGLWLRLEGVDGEADYAGDGTSEGGAE